MGPPVTPTDFLVVSIRVEEAVGYGLDCMRFAGVGDYKTVSLRDILSGTVVEPM